MYRWLEIAIVSHNESNVLLWIGCNDVLPVVTNDGRIIFSLVRAHLISFGLLGRQVET